MSSFVVLVQSCETENAVIPLKILETLTLNNEPKLTAVAKQILKSNISSF